MKTCSKCKIEKPLGEFYSSKSEPSRSSSYCKLCAKANASNWEKQNPEKGKARKLLYYENNKDKIMAAQRKRERANPEKAKANRSKWWLSCVYGITPEIVAEKLSKQNNKCMLCHKDFGHSLKPMVDHNHFTGAIRDMLCFRCNVTLGHIENGTSFLEEARKYLDRHNALEKSSESGIKSPDIVYTYDI